MQFSSRDLLSNCRLCERFVYNKFARSVAISANNSIEEKGEKEEQVDEEKKNDKENKTIPMKFIVV